jgi:hypothetical protein
LRLHDRQKIVSVREFVKIQDQKLSWWTYLFTTLWFSFWVGCCIKAILRTALKWMHAIRRPSTLVRLAFQAQRLLPRDDVQFDSNLFAVGVNNHASRCMGNNKRIFENLVLACTAQQVGGISKGLAIKGKGTLVVTTNDNNGKPHRIKIPNSLYLPGLRMCLLLLQHWAGGKRQLSSVKWHKDGKRCTQLQALLGSRLFRQNDSV